MLLLVSSCTKADELDVVHELINNDHLLLILAAGHEAVFKLNKEDDQKRIAPILYDTSIVDQHQTLKIVRLLPHVHHIVNFDGESFRAFVAHFEKDYSDLNITAGKHCANDILDVIEARKSRGKLLNVEEQKQSGLTSIMGRVRRLGRTGSMRRSRVFQVRTTSSSSVASVCSSTEGEGDGRSRAQFIELQGRFEQLYQRWRSDLISHDDHLEDKLQAERERKMKEIETEIEDRRQKLDEEKDLERDAAIAEFKKEELSKDRAEVRIKDAKKSADVKLEEFSKKKERELERHMLAYPKRLYQELYNSFVDSQIQVLQELSSNASVRV